MNPHPDELYPEPVKDKGVEVQRQNPDKIPSSVTLREGEKLIIKGHIFRIVKFMPRKRMILKWEGKVT